VEALDTTLRVRSRLALRVEAEPDGIQGLLEDVAASFVVIGAVQRSTTVQMSQ